jgi:1,2-diacylglycerol 3-beta-galactosyltransferase
LLLSPATHLQEEGNIPYVLDNGVGAFETDPAKIADIMEDWLAQENRQEFRNMAHRSRALGKPQAVYHIVEDLAHMADTLGAEARQAARACCSGGKRRAAAQLPVGQLATA